MTVSRGGTFVAWVRRRLITEALVAGEMIAELLFLLADGVAWFMGKRRGR